MKKIYLFLIIGALCFSSVNDLLAVEWVGLGTSASPYEVSSPEHLNAIRGATLLTKYFVQTADIDLSSYTNWDPIGDDVDGSRFTGNYNGDGYTISGLTINRPTEGEVGLFGCIGLGTAADPVVIRNVELVSAIDVTGGRGTGSLVGRVRGNVYTLIENCSASGGTVSGNGATGGLVGANNSARETNGGTDNPTLSQSWTNISVAAVSGGNGDKIGGLVGCNQKGNSINCYARGNVIIPAGTFTRVGGLAGCTDLRGTITNCFSTGAVTQSSATLYGGLVGHIGSGGNRGVVTDSYWDKTTSGQDESAAGTGYTTAQMKVQGNFTGFDFTLVWDIGGTTNDGYPYLRNTGVTTYNNWTGATSTTWNTLANWSALRLPIATDIAVIPSGLTNYPIITSTEEFTTTVKILDINTADPSSDSDGKITINPGGKFTVYGDLRSETTGIIIKSDDSGTGSLIQDAERVNATVQRYVKISRWNMVTPTTTDVTGQTFFDASASDSWLTRFDETLGEEGATAGTGWVYMNDLASTVNVGQGYTYYPSDNETVEFKGALQSADFSPTITWTDASHGYNVIGNPFSSALYWDATWTMSNVESTIWIWTGTQYQAQPGGLASHYVPVGQGFFVKANASAPSITIPASKRVHNSEAFLKSGNGILSEYSMLSLKANNNSFEDNIHVSFGDNGTEAFDNGYDASKMFGSSEAPQLYLLEQGINQSYDHLPTLVEGQDRIVAMSYIAGLDGSQTLIADLTYLTNANVSLEDLKTGTTQNLRENNVYNFTGSKEDMPERFLLHFAYSPNGIGDGYENASNINIYASGKDIYIRSSNKDIQQGTVYVYDLMGREIEQQFIGNSEFVKITVNLHNAYAVVKVVKEGFVKTEKVFIK